MQDVQALRRRAIASLGPADLAHLRKIERWGRAATVVGWLSAGLGPNPLSVLGLAAGRLVRWLLMHHIGHKGYDRVPGVPPQYTSAVFARGWRRFLDWPDWRIPEAWVYEHNVLHHAFTGDERDPDRIEPNSHWLRTLPRPLRWLVIAVVSLTWHAGYSGELITAKWLARRGGPPDPRTLRRILWLRSRLPYVAIELLAIPLLLLPFSPTMALWAAVNSLLAELLTNWHSFLVIGPSHTGSDLYLFRGPARSRAERAVRQVLGSANYTTGGDLNDLFHLWLNYQIEHHLLPDLPMSTYRRIQPEVRALCEKHGLPYVQEGLWRRFGRMARVFVGDEKQRWDSGERYGVS